MRYPKLLSALLLSAACLPAQIVTISGDIYDGQIGPLTLGDFHVGNIRIPPGKKLTISGCNLKFLDRAIFRIEGELDLRQGAYMTSVHDDFIGGDTNGNGGATVPRPGSWFGIQVNGAGSAHINSTTIRYAGTTNTAAYRHTSGTGTSTLTYTNIQDCGGIGADFGTTRPTLERVHFYKCASYAATGHFFAMDRVDRCVATFCGVNQILRRGNHATWPHPNQTLTLSATQTLNNSGVFVAQDWIGVPAGNRLVIPGGLVVKFLPSSGFRHLGDFEVRGTPTNPTIITSFRDDTAGGDTNGDGSTTTPAAADWNLVMCGSPGTAVIQNAEIRYSGGMFQSSVRLSNMPGTVENCVIRDGNGAGVKVLRSSAPPGTTIIRNCRFENLTGPTLDGVPMDSLDNCVGNVHGPGTLSHIVVDGTCKRSVSINRDNVPGRIIHLLGGLFPDGNQITIGAGIWFKLSANYAQAGIGRLNLLGTAAAPIVLTSIHDDAVGGDTNGNGNATVPGPGNWSGVRFLQQSASRLEHVHIKYPGVGLFVQSPNARVRSVRIEHASQDGARIQALQGGLDSCIIRDCRGDGLELWGGNFDVRHLSIAQCQGFGIVRTNSNWTGKIRNTVSWNNTAGNFDRVLPADVSHCCGGFAGQNGCIDVDPQFADPTFLTVTTSSPLINAGELAAGIAGQRDYRSRSRVCDWNYTGQVLPDIGAHELAGNQLFADQPITRIGSTLTLSVSTISPADQGVAILAFGFEDATAYFPPYGMLNAGVNTLTVFATTRTGRNLPIPIPNDTFFLGKSIAIQALAAPDRAPQFGNLTNLYRTTFLGR